MRNTKRFLMTACGAILCVVFWLGMPAPQAQAQGGTDAAKRGAEILNAAASAAGGEAVKKVTSVEFKATGSVTTLNGPAPVLVIVQVEFPDKARLETDLGFALVISGFDGKGGWFSSQQGTYDVPADMNGDLLRGVDLTGGLGLYKKSLSGKAEAEFKGEKEVAGQKTWLVEWKGPSGKVKLYFDTATKMLVAAKYRALTMQGAVEEERRWSDFRDIAGVKFPYHWVTFRDGSLFSDQSVTEVKLNAAVEAGAFARPQ